MVDSRAAIARELQALNATMSFASASSGLMHEVEPAQVYTTASEGALPISVRLGQFSQLKTIGARQGATSRGVSALVNQLGTTLQSGGLPLDGTGRVALDAEVRLLQASGVMASAEGQKAAAKQMTQRDTVNVYMHMRDATTCKADLSTVYRKTFQFTPEMAASIAPGVYDKSAQKGFAMDEHRAYMECATRYRAWPPQSGVPPWPARKA
jgi:hypothetical protein